MAKTPDIEEGDLSDVEHGVVHLIAAAIEIMDQKIPPEARAAHIQGLVDDLPKDDRFRRAQLMLLALRDLLDE